MQEFDFSYVVKNGGKILKKRDSISFSDLPKDYQEFRTRLGLVIAYIREYMGIKQDELTKITGINLFEVEKGLRDISSKRLYTLGEALNVHMAMLVAFTCCGHGEWTEENMKEKINVWKNQNKKKRKQKK